jgi:hypothetical protein
MQNLDYSHMCTSKVHYYMISVYLLNFIPYINIFIQIDILIHKYFCQIDDFTMHLWHLTRIHSAKSS